MFVNSSKRSEEFVSMSENHLKLMQNHQKKMKRYRSAFTTEQVNYLETQFKKYSYITNSQRKEVAFALNIPERAVKIWFQNRRMKEKRERNKEFGEEMDSSSTELTKDQLNNVMTPSANDQQHTSPSLPLLTDIDNVSENKAIVTNKSTCNSNIPQCKNTEITVTEDLTEVESRLLTPVQSPIPFTSHKPISANDYTRSEKASLKLDSRLKLRASHHPKIISVPSDSKPKDRKQDTEDKMTTNLKIIGQAIPEDLSSRKDNASTANSTPSIAISPPGYIQMLPAMSPFYSEPYYSASGVLWKPVSVVPSAASNGASVSVHIPNNVSNLPINLQNVPKKCCKCECHEPLLSYNIHQSSASPQYILTAVPLTHPSAAK